MEKGLLNNYFENFLNKEPLFINKKSLQSSYTPEAIPHREEQIETIASILAPSLRLDKPSNLFCYGKTGTGKTLTIQYVLSNLNKLAKEKKIPLKTFYLNCKLKRVADTEYRLIAQIARAFGKEVPATGLPTDEIYKLFLESIDNKEEGLLILVLDEIDQLVKRAGDGILYNLTRINSELKNVQISLVGISNDLMFTNNLDPRVKSSLSEEELVFPPYNAIQIQEILRQRASIAFRKNVLVEGVIEKCAAYAAREHGDARRALELLRVAGELAERKNETRIGVKHIDDAEDKIERDRILDIVNTQPKQFKLTLLSLFTLSEKNKELSTGDAYSIYKEFCIKIGVKPLTQRRVSDIISEFDMLGIINAKVISKGRYGRTREICLAIPDSTLPELSQSLRDNLGL